MKKIKMQIVDVYDKMVHTDLQFYMQVVDQKDLEPSGRNI